MNNRRRQRACSLSPTSAHGCSNPRGVVALSFLPWWQHQKERKKLFFPGDLVLLCAVRTHLRQPAADAQVAQPVDGVHHSSTSAASTCGVEVSGQHAHTVAVSLQLGGPPVPRVPPQLPLGGRVRPGAVLRQLGRLQRVVNHLGVESCLLSFLRRLCFLLGFFFFLNVKG